MISALKINIPTILLLKDFKKIDISRILMSIFLKSFKSKIVGMLILDLQKGTEQVTLLTQLIT